MTTVTKTLPKLSTKQGLANGHGVTLYDCNCHLYIHVVFQLMRATGCSKLDAHRYAETAQNIGSVVVFRGDLEACEQVANVLGSTGLEVSVQ